MTYAEKIAPSETRIDWSRPAPEVHDRIRGLSPYPGAWFEVEIGGKRERIRALRSTLAEVSGAPATVLDDHLTIACGEGAVRLTEVQRAGKKTDDRRRIPPRRSAPRRHGAALIRHAPLQAHSRI